VNNQKFVGGILIAREKSTMPMLEEGCLSKIPKIKMLPGSVW
jgi:hypothetical protein